MTMRVGRQSRCLDTYGNPANDIVYDRTTTMTSHAIGRFAYTCNNNDENDAASVTSANTPVPSSSSSPSGAGVGHVSHVGQTRRCRHPCRRRRLAALFVSAGTSAPSFPSSRVDATTNADLLQCISLNSRSIANKITYLNYLLKTKHPEFLLISISETWLNGSLPDGFVCHIVFPAYTFSTWKIKTKLCGELHSCRTPFVELENFDHNLQSILELIE